MTFLIVLIGWIFSLCLHEFSHALIAYLGGDHTVREKGYLTFNPFKYTHPVYSLLVPIIFLLMGGIGLPGGAVYIETWRLRSKFWKSAVSLAGPMSNLVLAVILGIVLRFTPNANNEVWGGIAFLALLQVTAVVLNLLPVPPFDGYSVFEPFLPSDIQQIVNRVRGYMIWVVFLALWYVPFISKLFWSLIYLVAWVLGIPWDLAWNGFDQFRFWA